MMSNTYHILNGDALKEQLSPLQIAGETIVMRESMVEGNVQGDSLEVLFGNRAKFISNAYEETEDAYDWKTARELRKIAEIPRGSTVNLWFEDDLFCQVNLWCVAWILVDAGFSGKVFLVRPSKHTPYGFGGLNGAELLIRYEQKEQIPQLEMLASLWKAYQQQDQEKLWAVGNELVSEMPFVLPAIQAHLDRFPAEKSRPLRALRQIVEDLGTQEFGPVFREFCKRESIYGFGDSQVKRLLDKL